jgi:hypothetical protein
MHFMFTRAAGPAWRNGWVRSDPHEGQASRGEAGKAPAPSGWDNRAARSSRSLSAPATASFIQGRGRKRLPGHRPDAYTGGVSSSGVYRIEPDTIFRVTETVEGGLLVEVLQDGTWVRGRIGMVGLRLNDSTTKLGPAAIRLLPA